jgi:hypothetical protein
MTDLNEVFEKAKQKETEANEPVMTDFLQPLLPKKRCITCYFTDCRCGKEAHPGRKDSCL